MSHFLRFKDQSFFQHYAIIFLTGWLITSCGGSAEPEPNTPTPTVVKIATIRPSSTPASLPTNTPMLTHTPIPPATPNGTATVEARLQTVSISKEDSDGNSAEDILDELHFFGGGGGGAGCRHHGKAPYFSSWNLLGGNQKENNSTFIFESCNWALDEKVELKIIFPDGRELVEQFVADIESEFEGISTLDYYFDSDILTDPSGVYTVTWTGDSYTIGHTFETIDPDGPRLYWERESIENDEDDFYFLYNFRPNEEVRVVVLGIVEGKNGFTPIAIAPFKTNIDGRLRFDLDFDENNLRVIVISEISGEIHTFDRIINAEDSFKSTTIYRPISNTGIQSCRPKDPSSLRVTITKDLTYKSVQDGQIHDLTSGQSVIFDGSPKWFEIEDMPGTFGWHWLVYSNKYEERGYVWQEYFAECEAFQ